MFDKLDNQYSHMPFAALNIQGEQKQLCCLKRNDVWKGKNELQVVNED